MIVKRLEANAPAVIPAELLAQLGLRTGDEIAIDLVGDRIVIAPAEDYPDMFVNNFSTFTEWASEADSKAYDNL
jgi:antitoxin component of MazEF toxin-antitoxin module